MMLERRPIATIKSKPGRSLRIALLCFLQSSLVAGLGADVAVLPFVRLLYGEAFSDFRGVCCFATSELSTPQRFDWIPNMGTAPFLLFPPTIPHLSPPCRLSLTPHCASLFTYIIHLNVRYVKPI